jgi:hypothetical protein
VSTFDPWTATLDQALAAENESSAPAAAPTRPVFQWATAQDLQAARERIEAADGFAVLQAVADCALHGLVMPDWLVVLYLRRYRRVQRLHVVSWDDETAFGRPYPKNSQLAALRRRRDNRMKAVLAFKARLSREPERAIDKELWAEIGREIGEGATRAEDLYRDALRRGFALKINRPRISRKLAGIRRRR